MKAYLPNPSQALPLMYRDLAPWFHLVTAPADYQEEAEFTHQLIQQSASGHAKTLLELGSGGGNMASHMKTHYQLTLVDLSPDMLNVSQGLNPGIPHLVGDMRTIRLAQTFDAVLIHDAIMYMTTETELRQALATAYAHLRPGGAAIFEPDHIQETYQPETTCHGHDRPDGWALRYLEWSYDPDPSDTTYLTDFAYLLKSPDHQTRVYSDRHLMGLFPRSTWLRLMQEVGFITSLPVTDNYDRTLFVGVK